MTTPYIAEDSPGKKGIMLGNDAIARGILEAGVVIAAGYPGTPSSEIMDALARAAPHHSNLKLEWSVNEKIAFEIAYAGSMSKARSVAVMKHIGVNVASDPFMSACYMGAKGGMVLISADDPNQFSSQNEQDNRYYGIHALIPVFEPSTPQEAKDLIKYAFEFSEKNNSIVLFRTTTRLNHGRGNISLGEIEKIERQYEFDHDRSHWVCVPSNMRPQRIQLLERLKHIKELADDFPFNNLSLSENKINGKKYGFIASGMAYAILMDVLSHYELVDQVSILKLGMVYPMPKGLMKKLLNSVDELIVVEELEPIFENSFKKLAFEEGISDQINIQGKNLFPQNGEFTAELLLEKIAQLTGMEFTKVLVPDDIIQIPTRAPQLCPGCSHRHTFYALNKISKKLKKKFINCTDIGCYTLGIYKPLEVGDCAICMGGSIGLANGFAKLIPKDTPILAILGDSTFYHSGIPSLINAIYNQNDLLLLILDNGSTSMTGGQDNPGTGIKITQEPGTKVKIEFIVHGCGVDPNKIWVQESNDLPRLIKNLEEAVETTGVRVFISKHLCSLIEMRQFRAQKVKIPVVKVDPDKCIGCQLCIKEFGCPAIIFNFEEKKAIIDEAQCRGCKVCIDICAKRAFYEEFD